ncbi:MAG: rRNA (uracil1498-N3)-methyltransferase [Thermosediminibacterales bacterium]|nr:rRNA (uracil1498-N3)-methyltransferase [Thermosediminibacterales bacterium]
MARFFVNPKDFFDNQVVISGTEANHISRVLRMKPGQKITVSDGCGKDFLAEIIEINKDCVKAEIIVKTTTVNEPLLDVVLFQSLPKFDKMDIVIQKTTELGIKAIYPVITERTVVKLNEKKIHERQKRWSRIAREAAKQSNRSCIPKVGQVMDFKSALNMINEFSLTIIPWEEEKRHNLKQILRNSAGIKKISFFIGPEGGFTQNEVDLAMKKGAQPVSLGPRILRTETAGIALSAILMYELGDIGG